MSTNTATAPNPLAALATLTRVETLLLLREPAAVFFTLALPLVLLVLNGSGGNDPNPRFGGAGLVDVLMAGFLVYVMATSAIMGLGETLADYRDRGILRRLRVTPLRPWQILTSHALTHLAMCVLGVVLLVGIGIVGYGLHVPASILATLLAVLASAVSMISVGFVLGALLPSVRTTQAVAAAIYFPAIFVSGALFPREVLPSFAQQIGNVLPMTYAVRAIREAWTVGTIDWPGLGILAATTAAGVLVAVRMFRWESR
ncbi:MAG TPA: ABC transporter permease [Propionibacteriaceae bacterium]|nr:ABC transporter permease [Propionibacteriaceae bacterium]